MDELTELLLTDPNCYDRAIDLLKRYQQIEDLSWTNVEEFLMELSDVENELLNRVIKIPYQKQHETKPVTENQTNHLFEKLLFAIESLKSTNNLPPSLPVSVTLTDDLQIDELGKRFVDTKKSIITVGSVSSINTKIDMFVKILTENNKNIIPTVSQLDTAMIRHYRDTVVKIPARRNGFPPSHTVKDLLKANKPPISQKTIKDNVGLIGEYLTWIYDEGYPIIKDLKTVFKSVKKPRADQVETRLPFTNLELRSLFESENYIDGLCKSGSDFWVPLIGLYTGARMGEIIQLHIADVYESENIWVFDINTDDEKQVKTESGKRLVPIHSKLISLGLLDYLKERRKHSKRLFPEEIRTKEGKFRAFSGRFNRERIKLGVVKEDGTKKDFHSFRHNVRTMLTDASVAEALIDDIVGHKTAGTSIGKKVYSHTQLVPQKKEAIEKLQYDIKFEKIKPWNKHRLIQTLRNPLLKRAKA